MTSSAPWYEWGLQELGQKEVIGPKSNARIIEYRKLAKISIAGEDGVVPWCSIFVNAGLESTGIVGSRSAAARSLMKWGVPLSGPALGCIVPIWRGSPDGWQGHVGYYHGEKDGFVYLLGGNQDDSVSISGFSKERILGYRWPANRTLPKLGAVLRTNRFDMSRKQS